MDDVSQPSYEQMDRERRLYRRLLELGEVDAIEPFLREALALVVQLADARHGYIDLFDDTSQERPAWSIAQGLSGEEVELLRGAISRGIVAETLAAGRTITTPSAILDARFEGRYSVQLHGIEAVLCAPIGDDPPRGVLYLEGAAGTAAGATRLFAPECVRCAELFARYVAPLATRLLADTRRSGAADPTREVRRRLRADSIVGSSRALATMLEQAALVAPLDVHVLLTGESGTGKSQLARVIHDNGPRAMRPFVEINCAALPDTLIESELFGALAGAHSTATRLMSGKVAAAEGGTLFLDEVGELSPAAQAKLLQLLQSKQYYPLGASQAEHADVRLIAATNTDLQAAVAERRFREDLYYRLHVLPVRAPSLAERREDIAALAAHLCQVACQRHGLPLLTLSPAAVRALEHAPWPGNVRQLAHALEAGVIRAAGMGSAQVEPAQLFPSAAGPEDSAPAGVSFQEATRRFQFQLLRDTLRDAEWNIAESARRLDLTRAHVYNLVKAFGLARER